MAKIFIATPAYDGKVNVQYAISFSETMNELLNNGHCVIPRIHTTGSLLVAERNRLLESFWNTDCSHILFIDSDLGWPAKAVTAMIDKDVDFVAGCYPSRKENIFIFRPCVNEDQSIVSDVEKQLLKMQHVPSGFMLIKREVIAKMRDSFPDLYFCPKHIDQMNEEGKILSKGYCLFNTEIIDGEFWGEDYVFCIRAAQCGFDIWCDPCIQFDHDGSVGMLLDALTQDKDKAQKVK